MNPLGISSYWPPSPRSAILPLVGCSWLVNCSTVHFYKPATWGTALSALSCNSGKMWNIMVRLCNWEFFFGRQVLVCVIYALQTADDGDGRVS
eukprot:365160-Chlamydomonas_euryale.AAC.2